MTSFLAGAWRLLEKAFSTLRAPSRPGSLSSLDRESTAAMVALALVGYLAFVSIGAAAFGGWLIWFAHRKAEYDVKRARSRLVDEMAGIFPALLARSANPPPWHDPDDADSILGDSILSGNSPHLA